MPDPPYVPSPEEIRAATKKMQEKWSEREEYLHRAYRPDSEARTPEIFSSFQNGQIIFTEGSENAG